jgi:hypothetical protein
MIPRIEFTLPTYMIYDNSGLQGMSKYVIERYNLVDDRYSFEDDYPIPYDVLYQADTNEELYEYFNKEWNMVKFFVLKLNMGIDLNYV